VLESAMLDMMGHISPVMLKRYSHIRARSRQQAIAAIEGRVQFGVLRDSPKASGINAARNQLIYHKMGR